MKRLVYSPKISAFVKSDSGIHDLSPYITNFSVSRKINQVSQATITFRNPGKTWTNRTFTDPITREQKVGPVFHPQDPITILLTRLQNRPVQVFTGYCDKTPYFSLYGDPVTIEASCTLKKLLHTYWDPGLPFVSEFLVDAGWQVDLSTGRVLNSPAEQRKSKQVTARYDDSGIGKLLLDVLVGIGHWDESTVYIEKMPKGTVDLVSQLFDTFKADSEQSQNEITALLHEIIGTTSLGSGAVDPGGETVTGSLGEVPSLSSGGKYSLCQLVQIASTQPFPDVAEAAATMMAESGGDPKIYNGICCHGLWQINASWFGTNTLGVPMNLAAAQDPELSTKFSYRLFKDAGGFARDWEAYSNGNYLQYLPAAKACVAKLQEQSSPTKGK